MDITTTNQTNTSGSIPIRTTKAHFTKTTHFAASIKRNQDQKTATTIATVLS